jgi:hypothetical protein
MARELSPQERAAALLDLPCAAGRPDFAHRAAACHLLAHCGLLDGFDVRRVWPAHMADYRPSTPEADTALALALLGQARKRQSVA